MTTILVVDDEESTLEAFKILLGDKYIVIACDSGEKALEEIDKKHIDIVLLDIIMPGIDGLEVLKKIKEKGLPIDVVMITATRTVETAVTAMKLGAYDYIVKPVDKDNILMVLERIVEKRKLEKENIFLKTEVLSFYNSRNMIAESKEMQEVFKLIKKVSDSDCTVLICGESGVGKELVARNIHENSPRKTKPFVAVNCAAIPHELVESELFGHEKGSYTSATSIGIGKFEFANEGTIFLDEVTSLSLSVQAKLLRVLQEKELTRIGGNNIIKIDVRIVASTNVDLEKAVKEKAFREDLYYRLKVVPIIVPPLRERKDDIIPLTKYFLDKTNKKVHKKIKSFSEKALEVFVECNWPGNVRELENLVERLVVLTDKDIIDIVDLPREIIENCTKFKGEKKLLTGTIDDYEKELILECLKKNDFNQTKTAEELGIHRNTLIKKMKKKKIQF